MTVFKSHIRQLKKINYNLKNNFTMSSTQIILGPINTKKRDKAIELIHKAIEILDAVE